jgi:PAS domain-containing protein
MILTTFAALFGALCCFGAGVTLAWLLFSRRASAREPVAPAESRLESAVRPGAPIDEIAEVLGASLVRRGGMRLVAIYAARDGEQTLDAIWRARTAEARELPAGAPAAILSRTVPSLVVGASDLARTLGGDTGEAVAAPAEAPRRRPFELATEGAPPDAYDAESPPSLDAAISRAAVVRWQGTPGWDGVAVVGGQDLAPGAIASAELVIASASDALGAACEIATYVARAEAAERELDRLAAAPQISRVEERRLHAERRMVEALQSPRRTSDLIRNVVALLAEGLGADRCYAVEVDGFHTLPIAHERRTEAAGSVVGLDLGRSFLDAVAARSGPTIKAITLDASHAAELVDDASRSHLGSVSRMVLPVPEKGRIVLVYVAEWIDLAKRWDEADVAFAERLVARSVVARERILQTEALATQSAHVLEVRERVEQALDQLQAIVDALPEAVVGVDDRDRVAFANRAAATLFGHTELELIGTPVADLPLAGAGRDEWARLLAARTPERLALGRGSDGHPLEVTIVPRLESAICAKLLTISF